MDAELEKYLKIWDAARAQGLGPTDKVRMPQVSAQEAPRQESEKGQGQSQVLTENN